MNVTPIIGDQYTLVCLPVFTGARSSIDVILYQWKWYSHEGMTNIQRIALAITAAARRGVKVRVILDLEHATHPISVINTRTAKALKEAGCEVKFSFSSTLTHAKMVVIDGEWVVLGSHNFSKSAFTKNEEASILIQDSAICRTYLDWFDSMWARY